MRTAIILLLAVILFISLLPSVDVNLSINKSEKDRINKIDNNNFYLKIKENWDVEIYIYKSINDYNNLTLELNFKYEKHKSKCNHSNNL